MKYADVLQNDHFNNLAAIFRVAFRSNYWRSKHAHVPVFTLLESFYDVSSAEIFNSSEVLITFTSTITAIVSADSDLFYTTDDMDWFVSVLSGDPSEARAILAMFMAFYSSPDEVLTPAEVANQTGTAESTWRNKAAAGEIPGAIKLGKQWLLPVRILKMRGVNVSAEEQDIDFE